MKRFIKDADIRKMIYVLTRIRGVERMNHFAEGDTLEQWRGKCQVQQDNKKEANKRACRLKLPHR